MKVLPLTAWLFVVAAVAPPSDAQVARTTDVGSAEDAGRLVLYWENDAPYFRFGKTADRWYTNGVGVSFTHRPPWARDIHEGLDAVSEYLALPTFGEADVAFGYTGGQLMFTPDDISVEQLIEEDRPYAGYLYGGVYFQRENGRTLDHLEVDLGVLGPSSLAEEAQEWVHDLLNDIEPRGWDNQLHDEFTAQFIVRKKWRLDLAGGGGGAVGGATASASPWGVQLIPEVGANLGTVQRIGEAGVTGRVGFHLPDDFGPTRLRNIGSLPPRRGAGWSAYVFGRAAAQGVEHDGFIEGNTYRESHGRNASPLVGQFQLGANVAYAFRLATLELGWSQTFETKRFDNGGAHEYGSWSLSFNWAF